MPQHSEDEIVQRRATVARLYLQGLFQSEIAKQVDVTQQQVSLDLVAVREAWLNSAIVDFNNRKSEELAKIDHLEAIAYKAWFDSMQPTSKKSTKKRGHPEVVLLEVETTETTEERLGDPRYLLVVNQCIDKRIKIFGLEAPLKIAQTDRDGKDVQARSWNITDHTWGRKVPEPDEDY